MSRVRQVQPALRVTALAAALAVSSFVAQAQTTVLQATGTYNLDNGRTVASLVSALPNDPVDVLAFPCCNDSSSSAGLHSYGASSGNFGSRSSGQGLYDVTGSFLIVQTVTNASSVAQNVTFNFHITPGMLQNQIGSALGAADFVSSGVKFNVQVNGATVWGSQATLTSNSGGTSFSASGDTGLYAGDGTFYSIDGVNRSVDLGVIGAGQSIQLSYELDSFAKGSSVAGIDRIEPAHTYTVPDQWVNNCGGGYGLSAVGYGDCVLTLVPGYSYTVPEHVVPGQVSGSHASSGDPFSIDFGDGSPSFGSNGALPANAFTGDVTFTAAVPEPGTWALMMGGLGVLGLMARRKAKAA
jgi:PEP-CTERM motif